MYFVRLNIIFASLLLVSPAWAEPQDTLATASGCVADQLHSAIPPNEDKSLVQFLTNTPEFYADLTRKTDFIQSVGENVDSKRVGMTHQGIYRIKTVDGQSGVLKIEPVGRPEELDHYKFSVAVQSYFAAKGASAKVLGVFSWAELKPLKKEFLKNNPFMEGEED